MADLPGEIDSNVAAASTYNRKAVKSESRRKVRVLSPPPTQKRQSRTKNIVEASTPATENTPPRRDFDEDVQVMGVDDDLPMSDPLPSSPVAKAVERKAKVQVKEEEEDEDTMDVAEAVAG